MSSDGTAREQGRQAQSRALLDESLRRNQETNSNKGVGYDLTELATLAVDRDDRPR
jgi:hypothetical protein